MIVNGISGALSTRHSYLQLGDAKVIDLKFLDEEALLVLLFLDGMTKDRYSHNVLTKKQMNSA